MASAKTFRLQQAALYALFAAIAILTGVSMAQADTWLSRIADLQVGYHVGGVVLTPDGGYALAGEYYGDDNVSYTRVARFTPTGELVNFVDDKLEWPKDYGPGRVAAFDAVEGGGYLLISEISGSESVWVARLDEVGNIMLDEEGSNLEVEVNAPMNFAKVIGNVAYLVTESFYLPGTIDKDMIAITKLNLDDFSVEWSKLIIYNESHLRVRSVEEGRNGALLLVGWVTPSVELDGFILEMSDQGVLQSFHVIGRPELTDKVRDVAVMDDGSLILAGDSENVNTGSRYDVWAVKINTDWTIDWQKQFEGPGTEWCNSVTVLTNNTIVIGATGRTWSPNGNYDFWAINIKDKKAGPAVKWQKRYWTLERDEAYDIAATPDGGFIFVGDHYMFPGTHGSIMVKADKKGDVYAMNDAEEIIDCPCETKTKLPMIDTEAIISNQIAATEVIDYAVSIDYTETTPMVLSLPFERICN